MDLPVTHAVDQRLADQQLVDQQVIDGQVIDEHDLYPVHEEDSVPVIPAHFWRTNYFAAAIQALHPGLWVTSDTCLYWERGNMQRYVAPDVAVVDMPPSEAPDRVYLAWKDGPLRFALELGSRSTFIRDTGPKLQIDEQQLRVPEYLYSNPPVRDLRLWRMKDGRYEQVRPDAAGRLWSDQLGLGFGFDDDGALKLYTPDGHVVPTYDEQAQRAEQEAQRAEQEAQRAEQEARLRRDAEAQVADLRAEIERLRSQSPAS